MIRKITDAVLKRVIQPRKSATHKGNYGRILLLGGNENYGGAIIMSTEGALGAGAGLIAVATAPINLTALHARDPEAMFISWTNPTLAELISQMDVLVCGPGLGNGPQARKVVRLVRDHTSKGQTVVLDASALDLIAQTNFLMPTKAGHLIFTPHQMEWQRLSRIKIADQSDVRNQQALQKLVPQGNVTLVLKSNHTHVYGEDGQVYLNTAGDPGMATGGMGDTLSGITGGIVAEFGFSLDSVLAAVYLHSKAADQLYQTHYVVRPTLVSKSLPGLMKKYANLS